MIKKSRDIEYIFKILKNGGFQVPRTVPFEEIRYIVNELEYPFVLKKKSGSGGINIYKIQRIRENGTVVLKPSRVKTQ